MFLRALIIVTLGVSAFTVAAEAADITGAGSTFVYPILSKWSADYSAKTGININYQSIGSGGGLAQIKAATVDFGASDAPMKPAELQKLSMGQFPLVIGGIAPGKHRWRAGGSDAVYRTTARRHLPGKDQNLERSSDRQAKPGPQAAQCSHRCRASLDGSGTTFNWVNYLSKVSPEWKDKVGEGTSVDWPVGVGGKGNEGVAAFVSQTKFSIGYVEFAYVLQNKMAYALVQNKAGEFIKPDAASFQAAAASAEWGKAQDFFLIMRAGRGCLSDRRDRIRDHVQTTKGRFARERRDQLF
jgi:phosphate transport system substrate-binding protein